MELGPALPHHDLRPSRYSSKPACSDFTFVRGVLPCASVVSPRAEPVVVCGCDSFGGLSFFAASVSDSALLRAVELARGEVTGAAVFARSLPDSTTTRVPTFARP